MPRPLKRTVKSRLRGLIVPACSIAITFYFAYHVFYGNHGILAWQSLETQAADLDRDLNRVKRERLALEKKVQLLRPESIDPDLLDERVRATLNFAHANDVILFPAEPR